MYINYNNGLIWISERLKSKNTNMYIVLITVQMEKKPKNDHCFSFYILSILHSVSGLIVNVYMCWRS